MNHLSLIFHRCISNCRLWFKKIPHFVTNDGTGIVIARPCYKNQTRGNDGVIIGNMYATKWQYILAQGAALGKGIMKNFGLNCEAIDLVQSPTYNMPSLQDSNTCSASITPGLRPGLRYIAASRRPQTGSVIFSLQDTTI